MPAAATEDHYMNTSDIRKASANGDSDFEILAAVIAAGVEYPDAVWKVSQALRMDDEQRQEMEDKYSDYA